MSFFNKHSYVVGALLFTLPAFGISANQPTADSDKEPQTQITEQAPTAEQPSEQTSPENQKQNDAEASTDAQVAAAEDAQEEPAVKPAPAVIEPTVTEPVVAESGEKKTTSVSTEENKELETSPLASVKFSLNSEEQKRAYASGVTLARYLQENMAQQRRLHITLDPNIVLAGIVDTFGNDIKMDEAAIKQTMAVFDQQINTLNKAKMEAEAQREREMGQAFWAEFSKQDGVKKSRTGLLYLVDKKGTGAAIQDKDTVEIELQGMRVNGVVFEKTAKPIRIKVADVIPALRSGIKLAGNGGRIKLVVPPEQGYGDKGALPGIPPHATLIFDINVLRVNPK